MADLIITERSNIVTVANAIRNRTGSTEEMTLGQIAYGIGGIGSDVVIDSTLTQIGQAADAKAVGDALANKQPIGNYLTKVPNEYVTEDELNSKGFLTEHQDLSNYALKTDIPAVPVQSINGKIGVVNLSASDVGALSNETKIPYKTSELTNDVGFISSYTETDPTVPAWAKSSTKPTYTADEVGALSVDTFIPSIDGLASETYVETNINSTISTHNTSTNAHNDIRVLINDITTRLNALADSDDTTLDQMSEIVSYIKSNKTLIEDITTNKINVSDIVNNLTTNVTNKPLSSAQGVALKALIDTLDSNKLNSSALTTAINDALAQAKTSGEFDGADGVNGTDGYSPVRGIDYWTNEDKAEIKAYVDESILGGAW